jgi:hypothetical protein
MSAPQLPSLWSWVGHGLLRWPCDCTGQFWTSQRRGATCCTSCPGMLRSAWQRARHWWRCLELEASRSRQHSM